MSVLDEVLTSPAFALIQFQGSGRVTLVAGQRTDHGSLREIPVESGRPQGGRRFDRLVCVPYAQVRERGFKAHLDDTPLSSIAIELETEIALSELLTTLPDEPVKTRGPTGFDLSDEEYAELVMRVVSDEIGAGEGANLVLARNFRATLEGWDSSQALSAFRRLLQNERGAYWTFLVYTGDRYLIGASPERHLSLRGGQVRMNPISGTFRLSGSSTFAEDSERLKRTLLNFLADDKETFELFMVVDEELKMMCRICSEGGQIFGPYLKPMTHLIHTEYILAGRTSLDVRDVLRSSMFAATVTGSPMENACKLISRYEQQGRGYYGAMLAMLGRDLDGTATIDAPILLRTADVTTTGELKVTAGATLVRDSDPQAEVAETAAKAAGVLSAFGLVPAATTPHHAVADLVKDEDVLVALGSRNARLSRFWLVDQSGEAPHPDLVGKHAVILDGEDEFVTMLQHMLGTLGVTSETLRHRDYEPGALGAADLAVLGPGPGDPRAQGDPKIKAVRAAVDDLLATGRPFLAVCLGHQVLCAALGLPLVVKDIVFQGTQTEIRFRRRRERVGFYNTFVARVDDETSLPVGVAVDRDSVTGDVHSVSGPHYRGIQFHAESILTENGIEMLRELVGELLSTTASGCADPGGVEPSAGV